MKLKLQWDTVFSLMPSNVDKMLPSTLWLEGVAMDRAPIPNTIMYQPEFGQEKGTHTKVLQQEGISCRQWKTYKTVGKSKGQGSSGVSGNLRRAEAVGNPTADLSCARMVFAGSHTWKPLTDSPSLHGNPHVTPSPTSTSSIALLNFIPVGSLADNKQDPCSQRIWGK